MDMPTYQETVFRFRVLKHEEHDEQRKQLMRERGIDPDDNWKLIASAHTKEDAEQIRADLEEQDRTICERLGHPVTDTFIVKDAGQATTIERPMY